MFYEENLPRSVFCLGNSEERERETGCVCEKNPRLRIMFYEENLPRSLFCLGNFKERETGCL